MGIEIERKFLPSNRSFLAKINVPKVIQHIEQTYLSTTGNSSLRIRRIRQDEVYYYTMAYKSGSGIKKVENEI